MVKRMRKARYEYKSIVPTKREKLLYICYVVKCFSYEVNVIQILNFEQFLTSEIISVDNNMMFVSADALPAIISGFGTQPTRVATVILVVRIKSLET